MRKWLLALLAFMFVAFPSMAEDPCDAVCRVQARVAVIRARRAALHAEHMAWLEAVPVTLVELPSYVAPTILSPIGVYGERAESTIRVRSRYAPYSWWDESVAVPSGGELFRWAWGGDLGPDEYFQVQLICPNGCHRGIHPPTKDRFTVQGGGLRYIVQDCKGVKTRAWDHESWTPTRNIDIEWTVAVIRWDGVDPSKIGATLAEAAAQWMKI